MKNTSPTIIITGYKSVAIFIFKARYINLFFRLKLRLNQNSTLRFLIIIISPHSPSNSCFNMYKTDVYKWVKNSPEGLKIQTLENLKTSVLRCICQRDLWCILIKCIALRLGYRNRLIYYWYSTGMKNKCMYFFILHLSFQHFWFADRKVINVIILINKCLVVFKNK